MLSTPPCHASEPTSLDFAEALTTCACDVFDTMVSRPLVPAPARDAAAGRPAAEIVGTVAFTGSSSGLVVFLATFAAARAITARLLGQDEPDVSRDEVVDAVGEITNMVGGSFRTRLATQGDAWGLSIPTVTLGSDFYIKPMTTGQRRLLPFTMDGHHIVFELIVTHQSGRS